MAEIVISYGGIFSTGLQDSKDSAKKVAKKLEDYEDDLKRKVYNKLNNYPGDRTTNISSALSGLVTKRNQLTEDAGKYDNYGDALDNLRDKCDSVDSQVANRIMTLAADFRDVYDISTNAVVDALNYLWTAAENKFSWLRSIGDTVSSWRNGLDNFFSRLKNWYDYHGGKDLLTGVGVALAEIGIAIAACVATIATLGGAALVIVGTAAILSAGIAIADGLTNLGNEVRGYVTNDSDPVEARRAHNQNTMTDTIMANATRNIAVAETFVNVVNITNTICDTIVMVYSVGKMGQSILKWGGATSNATLGEKLAAVKTKCFDNAKRLSLEFNKGKIEFVKNSVKYLWNDFTTNISSNYFYQASNDPSFFSEKFLFDKNVKYSALCMKNWLTAGKIMLEGDFSVGNIADFGLSNISLFNTNLGKDGHTRLEWKTLGDMKGTIEKIGKIFGNFKTVATAIT